METIISAIIGAVGTILAAIISVRFMNRKPEKQILTPPAKGNDGLDKNLPQKPPMEAIDSVMKNPAVFDKKLEDKTVLTTANKNIEDFVKRENPPLFVIAAYVFNSEDEVLESSEIINRVVERYCKNRSAVLPSDYAGTKYCSIATLEKVARGRYRLSPEGKLARIKQQFTQS